MSISSRISLKAFLTTELNSGFWFSSFFHITPRLGTILGVDYVPHYARFIYDGLLASNHNHASGNVVGLLGGAVDIEYRNKLPEMVLQAVNKATFVFI